MLPYGADCCAFTGLQRRSGDIAPVMQRCNPFIGTIRRKVSERRAEHGNFTGLMAGRCVNGSTLHRPDLPFACVWSPIPA